MDKITRNWIIIITIVAVVSVAALVLLYQQAHPAVAVDISKVNITGSPFIGSADAPVTIAYWSDYQCPSCKAFETGAFSQIITDYVNTGKVKVVFKDFAFLGSDSTTAAIAARAVWDVAPGQFYQWRDAMFTAQGDENSGWASETNILSLTKNLGIDSDKVSQLMASNASQYQASIDADKNEGLSFGIMGTPSLIIGKKLIFGAETYSQIKPLIDAQLNTK